MGQKTLLAEQTDLIIDARALLAVGLNGTIVVLQVNEGNEYLKRDANRGSDYLSRVLRCPEEPVLESGLYEFRGFSAVEFTPSNRAKIIHRGICSKVAC